MTPAPYIGAGVFFYPEQAHPLGLVQVRSLDMQLSPHGFPFLHTLQQAVLVGMTGPAMLHPDKIKKQTISIVRMVALIPRGDKRV